MTKPHDPDESKGVVEEDGPARKTPTSMAGQNPHRDQDPILKSSDSDFPEKGQNEEHTGEPHAENLLTRDTDDCKKVTAPRRHS